METTRTIQEWLSSPRGMVVVKEGLREVGDGPRVALARYVCEELGLRDARGALRLAGAQKALRVLEAQGLWKLPEPRGAATQGWQPRRLGAPVAAAVGVRERVDAVKGLELVEVSSEDDELFRVWNELMLSEHPLGAYFGRMCPPVSAQADQAFRSKLTTCFGAS